MARKRVKKKPKMQKLSRIVIVKCLIFLAASIGVIIIAICVYKMGNPFPYANYIGMGLIAFSVLILLIIDKSKWLKGRYNYPDNLGGP